MRAFATLGLVAVLVLGSVVGCNGDDDDDPSSEQSSSPPFQPDWSQTRHADTDPSQEDVVLGVPSGPSGPSGDEVPRRVLLLCNVDDDDRDDRVDHENAEIDGNADADDLALVVLQPRPGVSHRRVGLKLVPPPGEAIDAVRVFDESGVPRLGRDRGATWALEADASEKLESDGLRLFAEGCVFDRRVELQLVVDEDIVERVLLEVAPLLLAPSTGAVESLWICCDFDNGIIRGFYEDFCAAYAEAVPNATDEQFRTIDITPEEYKRDFWIQDQVEWGYTETPFAVLPVAIHLPRIGELQRWVRSRRGPDVGYVEPYPIPRVGDVETGLAYGGNLEPGPDLGAEGTGSVVHGLDPGARVLGSDVGAVLETVQAFLDGSTPQTVVGLDTGWLYLGHLDEMLMFVRDPEHPRRVTLLVASPADGLFYLQKVAGDPVPKAFDRLYRYLVVSTAHDPDSTVSDLLWTDFLHASVPEGDATLARYNLDIEERIFGNPVDPSKPGVITPLKRALEAAVEAGHLESLSIVKVPAFFYHVDMDASAPSASAGTVSVENSEPVAPIDAVALLPNMVNLVSVNGHLIAPDPLVDGFRNALLEAPGFPVHWLPILEFLHSKIGGIHCATNMRHVRPTTRKWWQEER